MLSCTTISNNNSNNNKLIYPPLMATATSEKSDKPETINHGDALAATLATAMTIQRACSSSLSSVASVRDGASETHSEISSTESDWSDIRAIAVKLGVANPDDLHTERFKIDRLKLEQMLQAESPAEGMNGAEYFFDNAMLSTSTYISWPCRLKIGAKNKKDPHVRIVGRIEDVQRAREHILSNLDSRGTRVIMKMDVSYTDHSYIIGRGGNNIKRIMEDTQTHIHFPDSNRANTMEKSNQVSLCGSLEGIERARALVRLSTPLLYSFELPVMAAGRPQPDRETPYVKMVENKYNVQVIFSSRPKLHSSLVLVKGCEKEALQVKEATQLLIDCSCENIASQISVQMQLEISPQHHEIVKGKNNTNLLSIMERTKTKIIFPDLNDMNVKQLKKSQVTITGNIDGVYKARQQLLGNLPIALIFDFPDNQNDASEIMSLSTKYGVFITLRQKQRQSTLAIVIKGVEKFIDKIYEARHEILRLGTAPVKAEIPPTYFAPTDKNLNLGQLTALTTLLSKSPDSPKTPNLTHAQIAHFLQQQQLSSANCNNNNNIFVYNKPQQQQQPPQQQQQQQSFVNYNGTPPPAPPNICPPTQKYLQMHNSSFNRQQQQQQQQPTQGNNFLSLPPQMPPSTLPNPMQLKQASPRNSCGHNTSGYQSYSSSTTSLECSNGLGAAAAAAAAAGSGPNNSINGGITNTSRAHYSPDSTFSSEAGMCARTGRRSSDGVLLGLGASGPMRPLLSSKCAESYRNLSFEMKHNPTFDFDVKRVVGLKAMERPPVSGELRTPTPNWIGMALSRTSPAPLETTDDLDWQRLGNGGPNGPISPYNLGTTTGVVDSTPTNRRLQLAQYKDIHSLFSSLGLEHYIKIFVLNEIDLEMFTTLTEGDLMELGITAFGARKKMLVAIHTLQANAASCASMPSGNKPLSPRFSGSAAPGAERRPSNQW